MLKTYIGTKIINAEEQAANGLPGYRVVYPDGYSSWSPKAVFEAAYREVSTAEREVLGMTDLEGTIAQISDGDSPSLE